VDANAHILRYLEHAVSTKRLAHGLLFHGAPGVGKRRTALWLAKRLNCTGAATPFEASPAARPCGECRTCGRIERGVHPDVQLVLPEIEDPAASAEKRHAGKTPKQSISIEQVRRLETQAAFAPYEGRARVVVVDPADRMEVEGMNAVLKLLEEPPPQTYLVFVSARPEALIPTLRSRTQVFTFPGASFESVRRVLVQEKGLSEDEAHWLVFLFGGSTERALDVDVAELGRRRSDCLQALAALHERDAPIRLLAAAEALSSASEGDETAFARREAARGNLLLLASLLRDLLVLKCAPEFPPALVHRDCTARLRDMAPLFSREALLESFHTIEDAVRALDGNVDRKLAVEHVLFALRGTLSGMLYSVS
jgi:DNA polymerase-3 subunit delta'